MGRSAHCRSSRITITGDWPASAVSSDPTAPNNRYRCTSESATAGGRQSGPTAHQAGDQPDELREPLGIHIGDRRVGHVGKEMGQALDERAIGNGQILVAAPVEHDPALLVRLPCQFAYQPTLTDSRLPGHQQHPWIRHREKTAVHAARAACSSCSLPTSGARSTTPSGSGSGTGDGPIAMRR